MYRGGVYNHGIFVIQVYMLHLAFGLRFPVMAKKTEKAKFLWPPETSSMKEPEPNSFNSYVR